MADANLIETCDASAAAPAGRAFVRAGASPGASRVAPRATPLSARCPRRR
ncbi:hypothetical protein BMAPRL20_1538 [Burkholderia mallei PRL-20]|nr:hypothetical protein BMAPRL20_1538 [Burkholderia mallei PRL-20]